MSLSSASFEELRELGPDITQAKRLLSMREHRGGFDAIEELDEVPGLPEALRVALKQKLVV